MHITKSESNALQDSWQLKLRCRALHSTCKAAGNECTWTVVEAPTCNCRRSASVQEEEVQDRDRALGRSHSAGNLAQVCPAGRRPSLAPQAHVCAAAARALLLRKCLTWSLGATSTICCTFCQSCMRTWLAAQVDSLRFAGLPAKQLAQLHARVAACRASPVSRKRAPLRTVPLLTQHSWGSLRPSSL